MQEVAKAGKDHGEAETVAGGDDVVVANGTAGLDEGFGAGFGGFFDAVGKWKKCVARDDTAFERRLRFHDGDFYGVDAAHLTGADAKRCSVFGEDDRVGFDVFGNFPGEFHGGHFFGGWLALGDDF